jgi:hypothetical protein
MSEHCQDRRALSARMNTNTNKYKFYYPTNSRYTSVELLKGVFILLYSYIESCALRTSYLGRQQIKIKFASQSCVKLSWHIEFGLKLSEFYIKNCQKLLILKYFQIFCIPILELRCLTPEILNFCK